MVSLSELSEDLSNRLGLLLNKSSFFRLLNPLLSFLWLNWWFLERFQVPRLLFSKRSKKKCRYSWCWNRLRFSNLSPFTENCVVWFECLSFLSPELSAGFLSSWSSPLLWLLASPRHSSRFLNNCSYISPCRVNSSIQSNLVDENLDFTDAKPSLLPCLLYSIINDLYSPWM